MSQSKQLGLAFLNYEPIHSRLPPGAVIAVEDWPGRYDVRDEAENVPQGTSWVLENYSVRRAAKPMRSM